VIGRRKRIKIMKNNIKCFIYDLRKDTVFFRCRYIQNKLFYPLISLENWIDSKKKNKTKKTKIKIAHFECAQYSQDLMRMEICAFFIVLMDSKIYANFILAKKIST